ncbi:hypothetical protein GOP47_0003253 [Adiantum capillus-veneris]|uniref:NADH dehydrogenase [ubiquinone] 1 alpha subcomplex subunit 12 n=1 Tax=Adiantum capillus-veneris TaxID=13818 RepID=A0A9D4VCG8_ADICA|nr:hypothetical protein GOP47_0003253 [Adiantum capillus-veneris]
MDYLRSALNTVKSTVNALRELPPRGFLATLRDGNLMEAALHSRGATLVGVDKFGNKYYEKLNAQYGRHRWVEYADLNNYDASTVPPEWHGWLHYITDRKPEQLEELKPVMLKTHSKGTGQDTSLGILLKCLGDTRISDLLRRGR